MKQFRFVIFIVYLLAVLYLCFGRISPEEEMPGDILGIPFDKVVHFCMFLPFPAFSTLAIAGKKPWRALSLSIILGVVAATSIELLQSVLTEYRGTDIWDLVANLTAIVTGSLLTFAFLAVRRK